MGIKNICIISSFGIQSYGEMYEEKSSLLKDFWNFSIFKNEQPIDVVDLFNEINKTADYVNDNERHVYTTGMVTGNYFLNLGYNVNFINQFSYDFARQEKLIKSSEVILISTTFVCGKWSNHLCLLIKHIRKINSKALVFIGGVGIYRMNEEGSRSKKFLDNIIKANPDYIIISRDGTDKINKIILADKNNGKCQVIFDDAPVHLPKPEWYNMRFLPKDMQAKHSTLLTSYGCAHNCAFCIYKFLNKRVDYMPINDVFKCIENIAQNRQVPLEHLRFADECFNEPEKRAIEICKYLYNFQPKFNWSCFIRGDHITGELAKSLKKAGCSMVSIGVESGDPEMQIIMRKNLNLSLFQKRVSLLKEQGIFVVFSLIVGFYGESEQSITNTINFLSKSQPDLVRINIWTPRPAEEKTALAHKYHLEYKDRDTGWSHDSMNQVTAAKKAVEIYKSNNGITFLPPFRSVFDQWPQLAAKSLSSADIFKYFNMYYKMSIGQLPLPDGLKVGNLKK